MDTAQHRAIAEAAAALRRGELVGMPTETVYGLAGDATNPGAVQKIFALKGRPADHPLIVHVSGANMLPRYAARVTPLAEKLAEAFWPGPLTLIVERGAAISEQVTGGQASLGLRAPAHPMAQALLAAFDGPLAAPSANRFGRVSPTTAAHVRAEFGSALGLILDGGPSSIGIESTIVDARGTAPRILRPGMIDAAHIVAVAGALADSQRAFSPRVSGALASHYAPDTPLAVLDRAALTICAKQLLERQLIPRLLMREHLPEGLCGIALPDSPSLYAQQLYAALRALDALGADALLVEAPPDSLPWRAIHDRLRRAASGVGIACYTP